MLSFAAIWMELENVTLSETSQPQRHVSTCMWNLKSLSQSSRKQWLLKPENCMGKG